MRDRASKDENTVRIARALAAFAATWLVGLLGLLAADRATDGITGGQVSAVTWVLLVVAASLSAITWARSTR